MENYRNYHTKNITGLSRFLFFLYKKGNKLTKKRRSFIDKMLLRAIYVLHRLTSLFLGCYVPFNAEIGENLILPHGFFGIFISKNATIGNNVVIFHHVTIGSNFHTSDKPGAPTIGDNTFVGAGAKIIGKIIIGENVKIGANAIVVNDVEPSKTVVSPKALIL